MTFETAVGALAFRILRLLITLALSPFVNVSSFRGCSTKLLLFLLYFIFIINFVIFLRLPLVISISNTASTTALSTPPREKDGDEERFIFAGDEERAIFVLLEIVSSSIIIFDLIISSL
jgi:hypothetical protein